ncbi:MAG: hypothetical protein JWP52_2505 [Rhizobacter sp.]|nr:hypothetical protein [Rhizobacter sp.]
MKKTAMLSAVVWALLQGAPVFAAGVEVTQAQMRATAEGQGLGICFVTLRSQEPVRLVGAESPASRAVVLHEMRKTGIVLGMEKIDSMALPAGETVQLQAGGNHLMLDHLKYQLVAGAKVPLTLNFVDATGHAFSEKVEADVVPRVRVENEDDH